jgi:quinol monooxygenase YgiN
VAELRRRSLGEPGCVRFEVYQSQLDPRVFILNEHWESQQALDAHRQAKAYQDTFLSACCIEIGRPLVT